MNADDAIREYAISALRIIASFDGSFATIRWTAIDGHLVLLDQTRLPAETVYLDCRTVEDVWQAIKRLSVRGAPAIGVAAAYGVCVGVQSRAATSTKFAIIWRRAGRRR